MKQQLYFMAAVDVKSCLIEKDPDPGKDWGQEEKGATEDEMVGWHHPLNGHEFEQAPGNREGQENLVCCIPWGRKQSDMTEWLNNSKRGFKENECKGYLCLGKFQQNMIS